MKKFLLLFFFLPLVLLVSPGSLPPGGAPPYAVVDEDPPANYAGLSWLNNWTRPPGPARVGLQVGHWHASEAPEEQKGLRDNTGASGGGQAEWQVNLRIAEQARDLLVAEGIVVDLLPTTIPPHYWADAFVAIHADGSLDEQKSGFKAAHPRRDLSGKAATLLEFVESSYQASTGLSRDTNVTRNMRGYYAFAWWRYQHAIHPKTPGVILETGFLTSANDRKIIVASSSAAATGIAAGLVSYLSSQGLVD
jgi:N-acetylmuramoyl-L-alanine amidase